MTSLSEELMNTNKNSSNEEPQSPASPSSLLSPHELRLQSENEFIGHEDTEDPLEIDDEFSELSQNARIKTYLEEIQTIHITQTIKIGPYEMFYILVLVLVLPAVASIISTFTVAFPEKLFFDSCYSRDPSQNLSSEPGHILMGSCIQCCNNRSFIYTRLIHITTGARVAQVCTVFLAVASIIFCSPTYARLMLGENMALFLLTFGVVIRTEVNALQVVPVAAFTLFFMSIGVSYCVEQSQLKYSFDDSMLGYGDVCDPKAPFPNGTTLFAWFDTKDNSSIRGVFPSTAFDYLKSFAIIFVPFLPVILKMYIAATTTFSRVGLDHLCADSKNSKETFRVLKYEIEEKNLMDAVEKYSKKIRVKETVGRFFRRLLLCDFAWKHPVNDAFGFFWGLDERDVRYVLTLCKKAGTLEAYKKKEKKAIFGAKPSDTLKTAANVKKFGNKLRKNAASHHHKKEEQDTKNDQETVEVAPSAVTATEETEEQEEGLVDTNNTNNTNQVVKKFTNDDLYRDAYAADSHHGVEREMSPVIKVDDDDL